MAIQFCDVFAYCNTEKLGTLDWIPFFFTVQFCDRCTVLSCKKVLAFACLEDHSRGPS